jgi:hypothetical protein
MTCSINLETNLKVMVMKFPFECMGHANAACTTAYDNGVSDCHVISRKRIKMSVTWHLKSKVACVGRKNLKSQARFNETLGISATLAPKVLGNPDLDANLTLQPPTLFLLPDHVCHLPKTGTRSKRTKVLGWAARVWGSPPRQSFQD